MAKWPPPGPADYALIWLMAMKDLLMRSTNIAELRNRLTQYLREVRAGEEIIVRDRQRPL